jgi:AraC-like DNA-binding protein
MDFHQFETVSIDAVKTAHTADVAVQDQYGVKYLQFWVNEAEGKVFCLVEGPDAATCEKVHQSAHGNIACALTEVDPIQYANLMGHNPVSEHGLVQRKNGTPDLGYRTILVVSTYSITTPKDSIHHDTSHTPHWIRRIINEKITTSNARELNWEKDDSVIGVFEDSGAAVQCALNIRHALLANSNGGEANILFRIGVSAAQPVTPKGNFFSHAIALAQRLCIAAPDNKILISSLVKKLCSGDDSLNRIETVGSLNPTQEQFLSTLLAFAEANLTTQDFGLGELCSNLCVSRPQLYRKIKEISGRSPNDFINDLRLRKALGMLKEKKSSIAEIAFESGFNSPSYFTKCFTEKFGCTPSVYARQTAG